MDLASDIAKLPRASQKEIYTGFWDEGKHQHEVGEGQIHHKHVGWGSKWLVVAKNLQYHHITTDCQNTYLGNTRFNIFFY